MEFEEAFKLVIGHEGGYVNDPQDPGGETKYGISKRAYPNENIKDLTLSRAHEIYRQDYWAAVKADHMPHGVRYPLFDAAVNHGPKAARKMLQRALRVDDDGIFGPITLNAVARHHNRVADLLRDFQVARLSYYASIAQHKPRVFARFRRGWLRRTLDVFAVALKQVRS